MNSTIIVQQNIGIPGTSLTVADSSSQLSEKADSVAAIIRPKPRETGGEEPVRLDTAASDVREPHVRVNQLEDYVNWLRKKFEQDQADTRPVAEAEIAETQPKSIALDLKAVVAQTVQVPSPSHEQILPDSVSTAISSETVAPPHAISTPMAPVARPGGFRTEPVATKNDTQTRIDRLDQPHASLPNSYVAFDQLSAGVDGTPSVSINSELADSIEQDSMPRPPKKLSVDETEDFIATISKAIASVLTETPEAEFEKKVRSHFESELQARAASSTAPTEVESVDADKLDQAPVDELAALDGIPVAAMKSEATKIATEILTSARKEIPTSVAAWDVEDFRWPVITNQMIVSGGQALGQLSQSVIDMITPGKQRIAIAGLGRGEGTTSIAISVARWAAACGKNVLVVDADLVKPGLSTQVGLAPNISWINAVSQSLPSAEAIVRSQKSNLCIMPLAQMASRVTGPRFIYDNLGELIAQVQSHFDLVLLDVGPANQLMAELSRPSLLVDASLLVYNGTNSPEFQKTKSRLEMFGLSKFIVAQNRAQQKSVNVA